MMERVQIKILRSVEFASNICYPTHDFIPVHLVLALGTFKNLILKKLIHSNIQKYTFF